MRNPYFKPWQGSHYPETRTVILSESTYDWPDDGGTWLSPKPTHPTLTVREAVSGKGAKYFQQLTRAICQCREPDRKRREDAWNNFAYTVYVQSTVGRDPKKRRPSREQWNAARKMFPAQVAVIQPTPRKLIVTGIAARNNMPEKPAAWLHDDLVAYDICGCLLWCLAVTHPANRQKGFDPMDIGMRIQQFVRTSFPATA